MVQLDKIESYYFFAGCVNDSFSTLYLELSVPINLYVNDKINLVLFPVPLIGNNGIRAGQIIKM